MELLDLILVPNDWAAASHSDLANRGDILHLPAKQKYHVTYIISYVLTNLSLF